MLSINKDAELSNTLRLAVGRLARRLRQQSMGGLTPSQRSVLASLDRHGPMTMSELADAEAISAPSATGIVSRLHRRGLVERLAHDHDRRCSVVGLSTAGSAELEAGRRERTAFLAERLRALDDSEREILARATFILDRLVDGE